MIVSGDDPDIDDRSATPLALLFHELATNAAKYGALSLPEGRVRVEIAQRPESVDIAWTEEGGPAIAAPPEQSGFGSRLIELSAVRQLGGVVERDWRVGGLRIALSLPSPSMIRRT